ncbi:MAG: hypothetical protein ACRELT_04440 [Longimicrobiales bacterium]
MPVPPDPVGRRLAGLVMVLEKLDRELPALPEHIFANAAELLRLYSQRAPDEFLRVRKPGIWVAAALHASFMLQPPSPFIPLPHVTIGERADTFGVSPASVSARSAELRRGIRVRSLLP